MKKLEVTEQQLIDMINLALKNYWPYEESMCSVDSLRKVTGKANNWEVESKGISGADIAHANEFEKILSRILNTLAQKYNVRWN